MEHTIKLKRMDTRLVAGITALGLIVVLLAYFVAPRLQGAGNPAAPDYWPTEGWRTAPAETADFYSEKLAEAMLAIRQEGIPIHSLTVVSHGYIVLDAYFYPYDGSVAHDMASVTKSVMATLIGIAADQGKLSMEDRMVSFFPDRTIANLDAHKQTITVAHLASMSSGLRCTEEGQKTQQLMTATEDWVQFTLDLPVDWQPGTHFVYCNPAIHLLSPILEQATGMTALEFARAYLFEPLGIQDVQWDTDPQGHNIGWGDIFLKPHDAAKIGLLWLQSGRWEDRQIVSEDFVQAASERHMKEAAGRPEDYGYGWWVSDPGEEIAFVQAEGVGGQLIKVIPALDLVIVSTGGGSETDQIDPYILAAVGDLEQPLPSDPAGVSSLEAAIQAIALPPDPVPAAALPEIAAVVSGQTYAFGENRFGLEWFRIDFGAGTDATLQISVLGEPQPRVVHVGLDGVYRSAPDGFLPGLARGSWEDDRTFVVEYDSLPSYEHYTFRFTFDGDRVLFSLRERVWGTSASLEATVQEP